MNKLKSDIMEKLKYEHPVIRKMNTGLMNKFGTRTEYEPVTQIECNSVSSLIKNFGITSFCYFRKADQDEIIQNANRIFKTRYPESAVCMVI